MKIQIRKSATLLSISRFQERQYQIGTFTNDKNVDSTRKAQQSYMHPNNRASKVHEAKAGGTTETIRQIHDKSGRLQCCLATVDETSDQLGNCILYNIAFFPVLIH